MPSRSSHWLLLHLGLGLSWCAVLASRAQGGSAIGASGPQVFVMLMAAGWLPSLAQAAWQVRHRRLGSLLLSDLLAAGALVLLACTAYVPLFFFMVFWFLPLALLPRGVLTELLARRLPDGRKNGSICTPRIVRALLMLRRQARWPTTPSRHPR